MNSNAPQLACAGEIADLATYSSKNLDHLGIVATVCREIGLADEIDRIVGVDPRQNVTCGEGTIEFSSDISRNLFPNFKIV